MMTAIALASAVVASVPGVRFDQHIGAVLPIQEMLEPSNGAPIVLLFGYAGCRNLCPTIVRGAAEALQATGLKAATDYRALFVSIDASDSEQSLQRLEAQVPAAQRSAWRFVRPNARSTHALMSAAGFVARPAADGQIAHAAGLIVVSPQGRIAQYLFGVRFDADELASALSRARRGADGPPALQLLLTCLHLDPANGRATATVLSLLRLACLLTASALGIWLWRRQGRAAA